MDGQFLLLIIMVAVNIGLSIALVFILAVTRIDILERYKP